MLIISFRKCDFSFSVLLIVREFGYCLSVERAMVKYSARCFKVNIAVNECVVAAVCNVDAVVANLVIELATVDSPDNAYKNSYFHVRSPFQSVSKVLMFERFIASYLLSEL